MGLLYLVQPAELVGTNRYKIGCSSKSNLSRVRNGYRKGTRYLLITECENPFEVEKTIKDEFCKEFNLIAGTEYFEGDEIKIRKLFYKLFVSSTCGDIEDDDSGVYDDPKMYKCCNCGKVFSHKSNMYRHKKHYCKNKVEQSINYRTLAEENVMLQMEVDKIKETTLSLLLDNYLRRKVIE